MTERSTLEERVARLEERLDHLHATFASREDIRESVHLLQGQLDSDSRVIHDRIGARHNRMNTQTIGLIVGFVLMIGGLITTRLLP